MDAIVYQLAFFVVEIISINSTEVPPIKPGRETFNEDGWGEPSLLAYRRR